MTSTVVVIQSRLTSSRLPGKAMLTVAGQPLVVLAARRAASRGHDVVVATSTDPEDDVVAGACERAGLTVFRGSLEDPLGRFAAATADRAPDDVVVRLTGDNCVPDGDFVASLVGDLARQGATYLRVADGRPYGLGAEAFTVAALRDAAAGATSAFDREHVTPWLRRAHGDGQFAPEGIAPEHLGVRCTVDTLEDYVAATRAWATTSGDPVRVRWTDLVRAWAGVGAVSDRLPAGDNPLGQGPWVLGTVQLGVPYGAANSTGLPSEEQAREVVRAADRLGVSHLDTAAAYGESEARLGAALARGAGPNLGVVTKVRPLDDVPVDAPADWARTAVDACVERSLRRLRTSSVAALLLHRWADWGRGGGAVGDRLAALREAGVARLVGASLSTPEELLEALADERVGYVQLPFSLVDRRWLAPEVGAALAARPDVVVTVRSVFLQGVLVSPATPWPDPAHDGAGTRAELDALVTELGRTGLADLCIAYARAHPWVTSVVLGAETVEQVRAQAELLRQPPLTAKEARLVEERVPAGTPTLVDPSRWKATR